MVATRFRLVAVAVALLNTLSACTAKEDEAKATAAPYSRPEGWQPECIGRWLLDVPTPIDLGASYATPGRYGKFFNYAPVALRESTRSRGQITVGSVAFTESEVLPAATTPGQSFQIDINNFEYMAVRLGGYQVRRSYPADAFKAIVPSTETLSAWAAPGAFQISLQAPEDGRGRFYWKDHRQVKTAPPKEGERAEPETPPNEEALARETLANLVPRYRVRKPGQMPSGAGVCTPHGFFSDPPAGTERDSRVTVSFVDPRYANLAVHVEISTRMPHSETALIPTEDIRKAITPWDAAEEIAREHKKRCRSQQGTSGGGIFSSCSFAGATGIDSHWDVQYMKLANGQEARAMAITYPGAINDYKVYEAIVETAGKKGSVTEPRIVVTVEGFGKLSEEPAFRGKEPPPLQEAFKLAVTVAKSLRPRPQAIDPAKPVVDPWTKFRR